MFKGKGGLGIRDDSHQEATAPLEVCYCGLRARVYGCQVQITGRTTMRGWKQQLRWPGWLSGMLEVFRTFVYRVPNAAPPFECFERVADLDEYFKSFGMAFALDERQSGSPVVPGWVRQGSA